MNSILRIGLIGKITVLEAIRHRVLNVLLLFALAVIGTANFFSQLSLDQQIQFVKDFAFGAMTLFGVIMAIVAVAQMLPNEVENRTLFTILAKPVRRAEFLLGKFLGIALVLLVMLGVMGVVFGVVLKLQEKALERQMSLVIEEAPSMEEKAEAQRALKKMRAEVRDPYLLVAMALVYERWLLIAAIALLISTVASSMLFTIVTTVMVYILGHLQTTAREVWFDPSVHLGVFTKFILGLVSLLIPDFQRLASVDAILLGNVPSWLSLFSVMGYVGCYVVVAISVASLIFSSREW